MLHNVIIALQSHRKDQREYNSRWRWKRYLMDGGGTQTVAPGMLTPLTCLTCRVFSISCSLAFCLVEQFLFVSTRGVRRVLLSAESNICRH